ncbi:MAG TPA: hypothetical protein VGT81_18740, partial [Casimicrobiaceae bacterium]|nr:hypothetical protein [Casimicrobiaceae bacterium]
NDDLSRITPGWILRWKEIQGKIALLAQCCRIAKVEATVNNDGVMVVASPDRALCRRSAHHWTKETPHAPS